MKVLVTGITGFIGQAVAEKFEQEGHMVIGLDKNEKDIPFKLYVKDMLLEDLTVVLKEIMPDLIIHCAGLANVSYSMTHIEEDFGVNTVVVYRFLEAMRKCELETCRFVLLSSAAVYGQPMQLPIKETDELHPMSPYALHKKMAEDICHYYIENYKFDIKILRIFSAYGPGLKKQIFWDMYQKIKNTGQLELFGTGKESRDYIYIYDLVNAIYLIGQDREKQYVVWNVANGEEITVKELAEIFMENRSISKDKIIFNGNVRQGDPINWCADVSRLKELGYVSNMGINEGIANYIKWTRE